MLTAFEEAGRCRRGYFVEGLGAAQFALARCRRPAAHRTRRTRTPRQPARASCSRPPTRQTPTARRLPGRARRSSRPRRREREGHRPGRKAGALVVLVDGALAVYVERGGKTLLSFEPDGTETSPEDFMRTAVEALALAVHDGWLGRLDVERADGGSVLQSPLGNALEAAGFRATPKGCGCGDSGQTQLDALASGPPRAPPSKVPMVADKSIAPAGAEMLTGLL